jgi:hypothetical protein
MVVIRLQYALFGVCLISSQHCCEAFGVVSRPYSCRLPSWIREQQKIVSLQLSADESTSATFSEEASKKQAVGNLVADDEWMGLSMELSELIRVSVVEDLKKNVRDFIGKEDYRLGDLSKEVDARVKDEVARLRNKDDYELFDLALAADEISKNFTEKLTGKPYQAGDLSVELDKRVKAKVAEFCGKDKYEFGDLSREVDKRVREKVEEFTSKSYEFGDISREVENRRREWVKDFLGEEAAKNYKIGDITKKAVSQFTGKDDYQFGDITKKIVGDLFGPRKKGSGDKKG